MIAALMFDMDGLLIDSEPLAKEAWRQTAARFGHAIDEAMFGKMFGLRQTEGARLICERFSLAIEPEELARQRNAVFMDMLPGQVRPMPGLAELLAWLAGRQVPAMLVTSAWPDYVRVVLRELSLAGAFRGIVTGPDVARGKPAPDCYLLAAGRLQAAAAECLVLEDAPIGIAAAKAAGMGCWAVPNEDTRSLDLSAADRVLASLHDVRLALAQESVT